jgi:cysteinyl-tRNA synthetase
MFIRLCSPLGLLYNQGKNTLDIQIEKLIEERQLARKSRDFKKADSIRDQLKEMGILLEDTAAGVKWKKV